VPTVLPNKITAQGVFIGPSLKDAIDAFEQFQGTMNDRYKRLLATGRRKITRESGEPVYLIPIDEYAYFSATVGSKQDREKFAALTRDLVARGRAAGIIIILATQRPSHQGRCALTVTTTTLPSCSTPMPGRCGGGSPPTCPAAWPAVSA
jgi:hypothetical protein